MVTSARRLLVIAAAAAAGVGFAQPARDVVPPELEQRLLDQIDELQSDEGRYAESLIEPFRALGLLYQEAGDHLQAAVALREARQLIRANRGLFSATVDEALLLRQQIRSEKELGNGERVWNLQHDLIFIARENLDDMRMLPIFVDLIDDRAERLDEFRTTNYRELPAGIYVPCEGDDTLAVRSNDKRSAPAPVSDARNCEFGTWRTVVDRLQEAVLRHYADALAVLIRSGDYASQELRDLEKETLRLIPFERGYIPCPSIPFREFLESELIGSCMDTASGLGVGGWASLMRLVFYEVRSGAPGAARANAFAELADWYLHAVHVGTSRKYSTGDEIALSLYEESVAQLGQGDDARESMAAIFAPELPVMLPTYARNPLASLQSSRFIDVAFAINQYGEAGAIEVLRSSDDVSGTAQRALVRLIKYGSFRPRAVDGKLAESAPVVVRYYLPEVLPPASGGLVAD